MHFDDGRKSMNQPQAVDRRIARTRLAIQNALVALIKEKGLDAITVRDIVTLANINRGTFYLHYKDKYDLLEQTEAEILQDIQNLFMQAKATRAEETNGTEQLQQLLIQILGYVKDHAELMHAILGLQGKYSFITRFQRTVEKNLNLEILAGLKVDKFLVPKEYLIAYVLHANLGVLQAWLAGNCQEPPREIARVLFRLSFDGPMRAAGLEIHKA